MGRWPELLAVARKFHDKPVIFIAVNSGNSPQSVAAYVRRNLIWWPVIVDTNRTLERQCGVGPICLNDIWQLQVITPNGRMFPGNANDIPQAANLALQGARWNIDPSDISTNLRPAWLRVELGDYAAVVNQLENYRASGDTEVKSAAEKLYIYVQRKLDQQLQSARQSFRSDKKWQAYKIYTSIETSFDGYYIPDEVAVQIKALSDEEEVKMELAAQRQLSLAEKSLSSTSEALRKQAVSKLQQIIANFPGTEGAAQSRLILDGNS